MLRARLLALLAPLALTAAIACQSVPPAHEHPSQQVDDQASVDTGVVVVERLLAVTVAGQTVGTVQSFLEKAPDGTWTTRELVTFALTREGGGADAQFSSTTQSVSIYDASHQLVSEVEIEREADVTITRSVTVKDGEIISSYSGPGRTEDIKHFQLPDDYRSALAVDFELVEEWNRTGQPATRSFSTFDDNRERFEQTTVTLTGEIEFRHGDQLIPAYVFRSTQEDGTIVDSIVDHDFTPLKVDAAGTFVATLVDQPPALGQGGGRINSELPVTGRTTNRWWELAEQKITATVTGDDPNAPSLWDDNHYHEVVREGERYNMTLLSTLPSAGFVAPKLPVAVSDPEVRRFLEPTAMAQSDDPNIVAMAAKIVGGETNSLAAASLIVTAVFDSLDKQAGVRGSATASEVLQNGAGDCTEHAVLVVALMRAAGIPARAVDGIVFASDKGGSGMAGYHAWAEIWLGQWIGVDATVNETGTSARYLEFGIDEPGSMGSGGKMMRSIGRTAIELGPHLTHEELR
ncbi:transglutaminase-like domain-containing protein [Enhygromyxa salina]|uniref:Transglutaminase-like superfamily protein n=1 Tax=Enhygromyxa salina TaxID=215803 RepID=A0A2S9Y812_9BACT|nr:transglutaminase-like domain-containing protein [Enhygromyxa salina]PRQ01250.1 Transglutaminase-like superfamily protein [Enhygromyxa salina]